MRPARRRRHAQAGFTLVELMVSLVLFSFAIAGVLAVAVAMASGFREQRLVIGTEGTARAAMDFVADGIRGASPGVNTMTNIDVVDDADCANAANTGSIYVTNSTTAPDELTVLFAYGSVVTSSMSVYDVGSTTIDVADSTGLFAGDSILITNSVFDRGALVTIDTISGNTLNLASISCGSITWPTGGYPYGSVVIRAMRAKFYVADLDGIPTLWMDPDGEKSGGVAAEPLAEGVEDFQVSLGVDETGDGVFSDGSATDEWQGNNAGDVVLAGSVRAIRVSFIVRAPAPNPGPATFLRPGIEDRGPAVANDNFRRRVLTSVVEIRNLGGSP